MTTNKVKVNISFEIEIDDLENLQTGIAALCSSVSYPDFENLDGKDYHPKWVHDFIESYHDNSYLDTSNGNLYAKHIEFSQDPKCEVCLDDHDRFSDNYKS